MGSWPTNPELIINGPLRDVKVRNITSGGIIKLNDGYTLPRGYTFHYRPDNLSQIFTLTDDAGREQNGIGLVDIDTDLDLWVLEPGRNQIEIVGLGPEATSLVTLQWVDAYAGI